MLQKRTANERKELENKIKKTCLYKAKMGTQAWTGLARTKGSADNKYTPEVIRNRCRRPDRRAAQEERAQEGSRVIDGSRKPQKRAT